MICSLSLGPKFLLLLIGLFVEYPSSMLQLEYDPNSHEKTLISHLSF